MWSNSPYTDNDLEDFEDVWANTIVGTCIDKKVEFTIGEGITPVLELLDTTGKNEEQINTELEKYEFVLDEMKEFDKNLHFDDIIRDATRNAKVFGRCAIAFEPDFENATSLKIIHTRDLGKPEINQEDWTVESVKVHTGIIVNDYNLGKEEMIYIMNMPHNPIRRNLGYGYSDIQRVKGQAKALERLTIYDLPEIAQSMWANMPLFVVNTAGKSSGEAGTLLQSLVNGLKVGAINAIPGKSEDITLHDINLQAKVAEIVQSAEMYERSIIGNFQIPSALIGREEEQTFATLIGKINFFVDGVIRNERAWLGDILAEQWYNRLLAKNHQELLEIVRVKTEFEPIVIENFSDKAESLVKLNQAGLQLSQFGKLKYMGLEELEEEIEEKQPQPLPEQFIQDAAREQARMEAAKRFSLFDKIIGKKGVKE